MNAFALLLLGASSVAAVVCGEYEHFSQGKCNLCPVGLQNPTPGKDLISPVDQVCLSGKQVQFDWTVAYKYYPSGCFNQMGMSINGHLGQGPTLEIEAGDMIHVQVTNNLQDASSLSVHWHGITQRETQWNDGAPTASCPIPQFNTRNYTFAIQEPGTYWYHSHISVQRAYMFGVIIVRAPEGYTDLEATVTYDAELSKRGLTLLEMYPNWPMTAYQATYLSANGAIIVGGETMGCSIPDLEAGKCESAEGNGFENTQQQRVLLIEDMAKPDCSDYTPSVAGVCDCSLPKSGHKVYNVKKGLTYRLRMVNAASNVNVVMQVAGHKMTVVEADARPVSPFEVDKFILLTGQTASVLIKADQDVANYWITFTIMKKSGQSQINAQRTSYAILNYEGVAEADPTSPMPGDVTMTAKEQFAQYAPKSDGGMYALADYPYYDHILEPVPESQRFKANFIVQTFTAKVRVWTVNNILNNYYSIMGSSIQLNYYLGTTDSINLVSQANPLPGHTVKETNTTLLAERTQIGVHVVEVDLLKTIDVVYQAGTTAKKTPLHPLHLHGQSFLVMATSEKQDWPGWDHYTDEKIDEILAKRPPIRFTQPMPPTGWVWLRFNAGNPGIWFVHCHIDNHVTNGFAHSWAIGMDYLQKPDQNVPICGEGPLRAANKRVFQDFQDCCHIADKCEDKAVVDCIKKIDPYCAAVFWDHQCVSEAKDRCDLQC